MRKVLDTTEDACADDGAARRQWAIALLGLVLRRPLDALAAATAFAALATILANALFLQPDPHPAPIFSVRGRQPATARDATGAVAVPRARPAEAGRPEPAVRLESAARPDPAPRGETTALAEPEPRPAPERPRSQIVSDIQRELLRRGLYDGPVNGKFGVKTAAALREFEKHAGLPATGEPSEAILKAMTRRPFGGKTASAYPQAASPAEPSAASPRAAPGAAVADPPAGASRAAASAAPTVGGAPASISTRQIKAVQQALADFGYGQVKPTGNPDAATRAAIEEFETVHKLPVTGQISERFLRELVAVTERPLE